ncbi:LysR substrate-binding domain-containing protein [Campylobacter ureolyticus]|uniref:LysR substrate-binding domain-containing protein n=1 Tax=Campylobacter ureolyticus TaxID=827 RepID=UPI0022B4B5DE|nr:LysR substrate-binding domain-containing protein [Campylobacter ureolyticus]MCZ6156318.1 LysR substrate-binding domain-containing protein [Campylobacter ureolyticus]
MTLKQIEYFIKVCELKQISECSKFFGISQSAMSIAIKNLENSLGGELFDRIGKSLVINERGKAFLKSITPIYNRVLEIRKNMLNGGMFDIAITSSKNIGSYLLPEAVSEILENKNDKSKIHLDIKIENTEAILQSILNNQCDIGLVEGSLKNSEVSTITICEDELFIVTGDKDLAQKSWNISSLKDYGWVMREVGSGTREVFFNNIKENPNLNIILELPTSEAIKNSIRNRPLFTCLPYFAIHNELGNGLYKVNMKGKKFIRNLYAIYSKDKKNSETFMNIINEIIENIRKFHKKISSQNS